MQQSAKKHDEYSERSRVLHAVYRSTEHSEYASFSKLGSESSNALSCLGNIGRYYFSKSLISQSGNSFFFYLKIGSKVGYMRRKLSH